MNKVKFDPNYFFCIRINDEKIIRNMSLFQNDPKIKSSIYSKAIIPIKTMHITLSVMEMEDWQLEK
jgi:hypothetical protein